MDLGWFVMVPILLKGSVSFLTRIEPCPHIFKKEIHMRYVSGYNDTITKLCILKSS